MKNKKTIIFILIIILILLIVAAIFGYYINKTDKSSYSIFNSVLSNVIENVTNQIDFNSNSVEGNIKLDSNAITYNTYKSLLNTIGGNNVDMNFKINFETKNIMLDMLTYYYGNDPINIKKYYDGTYEYAYVENYYENKYIRKPLFLDEYNSFINEIEISKDYLNILNGVKSAFLCKENSKYFYKTDRKIDIKIKNKTYGGYSNFFVLDKDNYIKVFQNINYALEQDKDFLKSYKKVFDKEYNIQDYNDFTGWFKDNSININIYSEIFTNKILKIYFMIDNKEQVEKSTSFEIFTNNKEYEFQILRDIYKFNGTILFNKNEGEIKLDIPAENSETLNMKLKYNFEYENDIKFDNIDNYLNYIDVLDKYEAFYQEMMDRREITNAKAMYQLYLYNMQHN